MLRLIGRSFDREGDRKGGTLIRAAFHSNGAVAQLQNPLNHGKAKAVAGGAVFILAEKFCQKYGLW